MKQRIIYIACAFSSSLILLFAQSCKQSTKPAEQVAMDTTTSTGRISVSVTPGYINEDKASIEKEIEKFHLRYNSGDFDAIYTNSIQEFQQSLSISNLS